MSVAIYGLDSLSENKSLTEGRAPVLNELRFTRFEGEGSQRRELLCIRTFTEEDERHREILLKTAESIKTSGRLDSTVYTTAISAVAEFDATRTIVIDLDALREAARYDISAHSRCEELGIEVRK